MKNDEALFCIYSGRGTILEFLPEALKPYEAMGIHLRFITSHDIINGYLENENVLSLIIPGATSGQACLDDLGIMGANQVIKFVWSGGTCSGICAGGFITAKEIKFKNDNVMKSGSSTMPFFDGITYGKLPSLLQEPNNPKGWQVANATTVSFNEGKADVLYWTGPKLIAAPGEIIDVIATYDNAFNDDGKPAIAVASKSYGEGRVIFQGPHIEISGSAFRDSRSATYIDHDDGQYRFAVADRMEKTESMRLMLFQKAINETFKAQRGMHYLQYSARHIPDLKVA